MNPPALVDGEVTAELLTVDRDLVVGLDHALSPVVLERARRGHVVVMGSTLRRRDALGEAVRDLADLLSDASGVPLLDAGGTPLALALAFVTHRDRDIKAKCARATIESD